MKVLGHSEIEGRQLFVGLLVRGLNKLEDNEEKFARMQMVFLR